MSDEMKKVESGNEKKAVESEKKAVAKSTSAKPAKDEKPGKGKRIAKWFRDLRAESKKVIWPTKKQTINNTAVVLIVAAVVAIVVGILDFGFSNLLLFFASLV